MATGGAWHSETFDNGRGFEKGRAPAQGSPMQGAGTPAAMYNPTPDMGMSKETSLMGVVVLLLRIALIVFSLIAFSVMAGNKQTFYTSYYSYYFSSYGSYSSSINFSDIKAFVGVLAMNCIVCVYAIAQLVQSFINMSSKNSFISSATTGFAMLTFVFDTILAYALIAASAAGADSAAGIAEGGCSTKFCKKAQASVAMSFFAFAVLAASAALYPVRLLRLTKS